MKNKLTEIRETVEMLLAVQMLEYHDRNLLASDVASRSHWMIERLDEVIVSIGELECDQVEQSTHFITEKTGNLSARNTSLPEY